MDSGSGQFRSSYLTSNAFNKWSKAPFGSEYSATNITLGLNSPGTSALRSSNSTGTKRKLCDITDMRGDAFLSLGLGRPCSPSDNSKGSFATVCTMSSAKETTDEGSSMDQGLDFQLHLGNKEKKLGPKKLYSPTSKILNVDPICDLNLSLSTGPSESVITNIMSQTSPNTSTSPILTTDEEASTESAEKSILTETIRNPARSTSAKSCQFQGCTKGARGASGLCIAHGGGRRCQKHGCHKGAEGKTVYCKAHGGGRRCQFLGCTRSAEGRTDYCIAHGGGRRCSHEGCTRAARGRSGLCIRHGGGKRCQMENCTKSAEGYSGLCISHGGGRRCQFPQCTKGAQGSTMFCKAHGGGKRCTVLGCTKGAEGSTSFCKGHGGGKRCSFEGGGICPKSVHGGTLFCVAHGGGKRCAVPECTKSARGRTDYCVRHGGGKRCKFEGCGKSAQGSTDFCKAHGGGKRCTWGSEGGGPSCDRFARGRTGMCTAHSGLVQDLCVHGGGIPSVVTTIKSESTKVVTIGGDDDVASAWKLGSVSIPEGRVHGGSLLAFLSNNAAAGSSHSGMHQWV